MSGFPFAHLPRTPAEHFKLYFYATVLNVIEQVSQSFESTEAAFEQFPFLIGYNNELAAAGLDGVRSGEAAQLWREWLGLWESTAGEHLPLRALREAAQLSSHSLTLFLCIGLVEEDARFGTLVEMVQGTPGQPRPTAGLLAAWWQRLDGETDAALVIRRLIELGLIEVVNPDAPRMGWALRVPAPVWDAARGAWMASLAPGLRYRAPHELLPFDSLIILDALHHSLAHIPELLVRGEARTVIMRGPQANGRRTMVGAVARALGYGLLEVSEPAKTNEGLLGPLATLLHAFPTFVLELGPGETAELPALAGYHGPVSVVLGKQGGVKGKIAEQAITLTLEMPQVEERRRHWELSLDAPGDNESLATLANRFRLTSGNIRRVAKLAQTYAALEERSAITMLDAHRAHRALNRQVLDTLAAHLSASGDWTQLAASADTLAELRDLETLCRHRERLGAVSAETPGAQRNAGVRALFSGPSGTGKTLAAQLLASSLQMDVYRLDLSAVVNKYIGETEKNLNQVFARAEELDVILLIDEGDALLTQRTAVQTSNDRYANLETNYLLQRIESFEGILIITTNAPDRIDSAFQRRMDVVVEFRPPEAAERWAIWQLHLPLTHTVDTMLLQEIAGRCSLSGGQIRNVALHAILLALNNGGIVTSAYLEAAVRREYRKLGAVCPLRTSAISVN